MSKINLLTKPQSYFTLELYFKYFRIVTYTLLILFIIVSSAFFAIKQLKSNELNSILIKKQEYLNYFIKENTNEADFVYFVKKKKQLNEFLKDDVRLILLPYYKLLTNTIQSLPGAVLVASKINIDRTVNFEIRTTTYESLSNIFKLVESDQFINKFDELKLNSFSASEVTSNDYKLSFSGTLKELNN